MVSGRHVRGIGTEGLAAMKEAIRSEFSEELDYVYKYDGCVCGWFHFCFNLV